MKKSGYRSALHIYLIFFLSLLGTVLVAAGLFFLMINVKRPDESRVRSDWPKNFTLNFKDQIIFPDGRPQMTQTGMELLEKNQVGLQLLDVHGNEQYSFHKPDNVPEVYEITELLHISESGRLLNMQQMSGNHKNAQAETLYESQQMSAFIGTVSDHEKEFVYILHFPVSIKNVTMYVNGTNFSGGKTMLLSIAALLFLGVLLSGLFYGFYTAKTIRRITGAIGDIAGRTYYPMPCDGAYGDIYERLNTLDEEIRAGDRLREETEKAREEWIANITHDLKTPLSPIKGYAELMGEGDVDLDKYQRYAGIIVKNAVSMESLINDLKLTYQLDNGMVPLDIHEQNIVRFVKELVIDILNDPEYESRKIHFECSVDSIMYCFDEKLFRRALLNLIINGLVHGESHTEIWITVTATAQTLQITVSDNGPGMTQELAARLFERYYRGTNTAQKPGGTGLGMAIAKNIVRLHKGTIFVDTAPGAGTRFVLTFPYNDV